MNDITYHCKVIIDNDEEYANAVDCLTTHVVSKVYHRFDGQAYEDQKKARSYVLSTYIRRYVEEITDAAKEYFGKSPMAKELLLGAIQEIDFREISEDLIGDYSPKSTEEVAENEEFFNAMGFSNYDIDED